jgi:pimeloyl-ACP methyl ester carboxylesterase
MKRPPPWPTHQPLRSPFPLVDERPPSGIALVNPGRYPDTIPPSEIATGYLSWYSHPTALVATLLLLFLLLAGCQQTFPEPILLESDAGYLIEYGEDECPFELFPGDEITCGYMTVPEDRSDPDGPSVDIAVAILHSTSDNPAPDPVLYLEGGPGGSSLAYPDDWLSSPLLDTRDIILFDQRGTGFSWPSLDCQETDAYDIGDYGDYETRLDAVEACRQRLRDQGIDLAAYNSAASAADVADLRQALGIEEWNLYGISYGTRLALTILRDHPDGVRSVVLDSVYPPNADGYVENIRIYVDAVQALLDGCARDPACAEAFPDLPSRFLTALTALEETPLLLDEEDAVLPRESAAEEWAYEYGAVDVFNTLVDLLYDTDAIATLPLAMDALADGDVEQWFAVTEDPVSDETWDEEVAFDEEMDAFLEEISDSQGMFYSVECHEEVVFGNEANAVELVATSPQILVELALADHSELYDVCRIWGAGSAGARETESVSSDLPVLLMSGEFDPVTPPAWGNLAAETLAAGTHLVLPRGGHAASVANECTTGIVAAFIDDPLASFDDSCLTESVLPFVIDLADLD